MKKNIKWHETCKCKWIIDATVCNNQQRWNEYKWRSTSKELNYKRICDKWFIWAPSNCECDKSCDVGEYLAYKKCKFKKILIDINW